jgi:hypothetical protein
MKKITFLLILTLISIQFTAQEKGVTYPQDLNKKHELKLNTFNLIIFSSIDVSYEYLLNKDSSFGVGVFYNFNDISNDMYYPKKFSIAPYYRWFFSETRYARGFFVEGFGMLNRYEEELYYYGNPSKIEKETNFALGVSVGGKFIIHSGFTAEVYLGVGRNLFNNDNSNDSGGDLINNNIISRGGLSLGYRF